MKKLQYINQAKPEYVFRPIQIFFRIYRSIKTNTGEFETVTLPWKLKIRIRPSETLGSCVWRMGLYDLCVSESIHKLLDTGELAVDVGANIGHMTGLMAFSVGLKGKVFAFEPHPEIYQELMFNVNNWALYKNIAQITAVSAAASDHSGTSSLIVPIGFSKNRGLSSLVDNNHTTEYEKEYSVQLIRLDNFFENEEEIHVIKIDTEGHELSVLEGMENLLKNHQIRDIIFEDHNDYPSEVMRFLENFGYTLFYLGQNLHGLCIGNIKNKNLEYITRKGDPPSYLATIQPKRAISRLQKKGWSVLSI